MIASDRTFPVVGLVPIAGYTGRFETNRVHRFPIHCGLFFRTFR